MSDTDIDIDERDRELAATIRVALQARARAIAPAPRECPSPSPRRSSAVLVGISVLVVLVAAAVVVARVAGDGETESTRLAATGRQTTPTSMPTVTAVPGAIATRGPATTLPGGPPSTFAQSIIATGRSGEATWIYGTQGPNDCFTVTAAGESWMTCGLHSGTDTTIPTRSTVVGDINYFLAFSAPTTVRISLTMPNGSNYDLEPVATAPDGASVFFGALPMAVAINSAPNATVYDKDGTNRVQRIPIGIRQPTGIATTTTR